MPVGCSRSRPSGFATSPSAGRVLGGLTPGHVDPALELARTGAARVYTALQAWPVFVRLLLFPLTLLADYGPRILLPTQTLDRAAIVGALLLGLTLIGGLVALARGAPRAAFGLLWFPVAIFPVSNLAVPIGVLVAERTLYLPSVAISVAVAGLVVTASRFPARIRRFASLAAAITVCVARGTGARAHTGLEVDGYDHGGAGARPT